MEQVELINYIKSQFIRKFKEYIKKTSKISYEQIISEICYENTLDEEVVKNITEVKTWYDNVYYQKYLKELVDLNANEIIINNGEEICLIYHDKKEYYYLESISKSDFNMSLELLAYRNQHDWNFSKPFISFQVLLYGVDFRCSLVNSSIKDRGYHQIFLRTLSKDNYNLCNFVDQELEEELIRYVAKKKNIIVAGSTGSGKTTFLNTLIKEVDVNEHIVCLEDTKELSLENKFATRLLASNFENKTMKDYCKYALRMSPDRVILGEIRAEEIVPLVLAMNTGHDGMMSSIHANNAKDTLHRLALLFTIYSDMGASISYEQILKLICTNIDIIVFIKNKAVHEVIEVIGSEKQNPIYNQLYLEDQGFSLSSPLPYVC